MIDILVGTYGGSNTWYGLCNTLDFWEEELDRKNIFITMDEDDSAYLLEWILDKYYDKTINEDGRFEHWGENYFEISVVHKVLEEVEEFCNKIKIYCNSRIIEIE